MFTSHITVYEMLHVHNQILFIVYLLILGISGKANKVEFKASIWTKGRDPCSGVKISWSSCSSFGYFEGCLPAGDYRPFSPEMNREDSRRRSFPNKGEMKKITRFSYVAGYNKW